MHFIKNIFTFSLSLASCLLFLECAGEKKQKEEVFEIDMGEEKDEIFFEEFVEEKEEFIDIFEEVQKCPDGVKECLDKFGKNDPSLCPEPKSNYECVNGCCVLKFIKCTTDKECEEHRDEFDYCPDKRYKCICSKEDEWCHPFYCSIHEDCSTDGSLLCSEGNCVPLPSMELLKAKILTPSSVIKKGKKLQLKALAYSSENPSIVTDNVKFEWQILPAGIVQFDKVSETITGGDKEGSVSVRARVQNGNPQYSDPVEILNLPEVENGKMRILLFEEGGIKRLDGKGVIIKNGEKIKFEIKNGIFVGDLINDKFDIHIFTENMGYLSSLGVEGNDLIFTLPKPYFARLKTTKEGELKLEDQKVENVDILTGSPDYKFYWKKGEFEVAITGLSFSSEIFAFELSVVIGPDMEKYFHPDSPTVFPKDKPQILPGGFTLKFGGSPVITKYYIAAPPKKYSMWSIGGRIAIPELQENASMIFEAIGGGEVDINLLVSALFPLFSSFYTSIEDEVVMSENLKFPVGEKNIVLKVPMGLHNEVKLPELPSLGDKLWTDIVILIACALMPDGRVIPIGISAASDKKNADDIPDGKVNVNPLHLYYSPIGGGLWSKWTRYAILAITAVLDPKGKGEGGSGIIFRGNEGEKLSKKTISLPEFHPVTIKSTYNKSERKITITNVENTLFYRVLLKRNDNRNWIIFVPSEKNEIILPLPSEVDENFTDYFADAKDIIINAFKMDENLTYKDIFELNEISFSTLILFLEKTSYLNIK